LINICFTHCVDKAIAQTQMFGVHYMPVWIYTLATYLRDIPGINISMFDARFMSESELPTADLYLFTGINQDYVSIMDFLKRAKTKRPEAKYIIGGPICWSYSQAGKVEKLFDFDHIVIGDGEPIIKEIVQKFVSKEEIPKIVQWSTKFEVKKSIIMDRQLLDETIHNYYGAVIEVSRGCPFLCEFCDIRIQKDNNQPHNVAPEKIVAELDYFARKGVKQILFACDNFIGDPNWAETVCDHIVEWKRSTGLEANLYTWLTINVSNYGKLLEKLKAAGFDMFFIGIESFESNQLLETAKIQNVKTGLIESIQKIQSYGFIVVAGLIFGFDTEPEYVSDSTLDGILKSGLISGEPSLLTALPGTPLYKRMKFSSRLRDGKLGLGGHKYQTNIKYLKPTSQIIENFQRFVTKYNKGAFQYQRFSKFCSLIQVRPNEKPANGGYINIGILFKLAFKNKTALSMLVKRLIKLFLSPERTFYFLMAFFLAVKYQLQGNSVWKYFSFWMFVWSNSVIKFETLKPSDFDIGSVDENFDLAQLVPDEYMNDLTEPIPDHKMKTQRKFTAEALRRLQTKT
jgi:radical SAM superfamily enzyme YgiQ (UPF0313 family)